MDKDGGERSRSDGQIRGAVFGIAAAALFGLSAPLGKLLMQESSPVALASLLYLGAAGALLIVELIRRPTGLIEAPIRRADTPLLIGIMIAGGVIGPVLMLFGLARASAVAGSLLLNLEAPFTILLAVGIFGEHLGWRAALAAGWIILGGAALGLSVDAATSQPVHRRQ